VKMFLVAGARPNFVKIAPLVEAFERAAPRDRLEVRLVNTGQHYDPLMAGSFFEELGIREPDVDLGVGSGTHAEQTARILIAFERLLVEERPRLVVVVGDVNSTLACALAAAKLGIDIAHVEAGLRSRDRSMPEEINRIVTDALSSLCFTTCVEASENLAHEGIATDRIFFVGNVMIDTLLRSRDRARPPASLATVGLRPREYALITLHRAGNVDRPVEAGRVVAAAERAAARLPLVFPMHPRTRQMLERHGLLARLLAVASAHLVEPLPYLEFLYVMDRARVVLTDSGGIQEETSVLGVPCLTLRQNTERPITIEQGTNRLVGLEPDNVAAALDEVLAAPMPRARPLPLWDGRAAERIADITVRHYGVHTAETGMSR